MTMSTAESELVGICGGVTALKSLFLGKIDRVLEVKKVVYSDSQAALAACQTSAGSWRTRHLRIRGSMLRELLDGPDWTSYHLEGHLMLADLGTKGVPADRFWHLMQLMGLHRPVADRAPSRVATERVKQMLAMMMIVAFPLESAAASGGEVVVANSVVLSRPESPNYLALLILIITSIAVWEFIKGAVAWLRRCCCCVKKEPESSDSDSDPPSPPARTALPKGQARQRRARPAARNRDGQVLTRVIMTPNGTCAHASTDCATLNGSQSFVERRLCTVCCRIR